MASAKWGTAFAGAGNLEISCNLDFVAHVMLKTITIRR